MKEITVSKKRIRTEIMFWICSFIVAFLLNVYAIIKYNTEWKELFTQLHVVTLVSVLFYFLIAALRTVFYLIEQLIKKIKK